MKSFFLAFVALTLAVDAAIALECYNCAYLDGAEDVDLGELEVEFDKSCQSGKKPNKKYSSDCLPGADSCAKIVVEEGDAKVTIRTCWVKQLNEMVGVESGKCVEKSGKDLAQFVGQPVPDSTKATFCTCTDDKCNSSSMLKVTQGSLMVLVVGFLTSKFMY